MVEPVTAVLTGIGLVKAATSFIKENINTVNDISDIAKQIDQMFEGQQQINKERSKKANSTANELGLSNVADSIISARLAAEEMQECKNLINLRFGPTTWDSILIERKRRIDARKQAIKEAKAAKLKKQQEIAEYIKYGLITIVTLAFIGVSIGITIKFFVSITHKVYAHNIEYDDGSCRLYEPKYFLICMSEGRDYADTELYLDYKKNRGNWIVDDEE